MDEGTEEGSSMNSEWKVSTMTDGGNKYYQVYRLRDKDRTDHSGNREYLGNTLYITKEKAQSVADKMNREEKK